MQLDTNPAAPAQPWKVTKVTRCTRSGLRFEGENHYYTPDSINFRFYWGHDGRRAPDARYDFSGATFADEWCRTELARRCALCSFGFAP